MTYLDAVNLEEFRDTAIAENQRIALAKSAREEKIKKILNAVIVVLGVFVLTKGF